MLLLCRRNTRQEGGPRPVESLVAAVDAILLRHCFPSSSRLRSIEDRIQSPEIPIAHDSLTHQLHMSDKDLLLYLLKDELQPQVFSVSLPHHVHRLVSLMMVRPGRALTIDRGNLF